MAKGKLRQHKGTTEEPKPSRAQQAGINLAEEKSWWIFSLCVVLVATVWLAFATGRPADDLALDVTGRPLSDPSDARIAEEFLAWVQENGGYVNPKVSIGEVPVPIGKDKRIYIRGLYANAALAKGELVTYVPLELTPHADTVGLGWLYGQPTDSGYEVDQRDTLAVWYMLEQGKLDRGETDSFWAPLIRLWGSGGAFPDSPVFWTVERLKASPVYVQGTYTEFFREQSLKWLSMLPLLKARLGDPSLGLYSFDKYLQAMAIVDSRAEESAKDSLRINTVQDLLNHDFPKRSTLVDEPAVEGSHPDFEARGVWKDTKRPVPKGASLTYAYTPRIKCDEAMLMRWGINIKVNKDNSQCPPLDRGNLRGDCNDKAKGSPEDREQKKNWEKFREVHIVNVVEKIAVLFKDPGIRAWKERVLEIFDLETPCDWWMRMK